MLTAACTLVLGIVWIRGVGSGLSSSFLKLINALDENLFDLVFWSKVSALISDEELIISARF